jgi:hypothetical protein
MNAPFVFAEEAGSQLLDIIDHISAESEDAAVRVYAATDHSLQVPLVAGPRNQPFFPINIHRIESLSSPRVQYVWFVFASRLASQSWRTFLANHAAQIAAADFFVVPTVAFRLLFVLLILAHERRRVVHVAVTAHPTAAWTCASPQSDRQPSRLIRWSVHRAVARENLALRQQLAVFRRTVPRSPLRDRDRLFWLLLAHAWRDWRTALIHRAAGHRLALASAMAPPPLDPTLYAYSSWPAQYRCRHSDARHHLQ